MTKADVSLAGLLAVRREVQERRPLIHCITNPISINDCANAVLAAGAKPIMAEHPAEVAGVTATAAALAVNLGNITDSRMAAMRVSGKVAGERKLPSVLDLVGVGCSRLRLDFAREFIAECRPAVIKGNMSEIKTLSKGESHAQGIDAGEQDSLTGDNMADTLRWLRELSLATGAVITVTGRVDVITDGRTVFLLENGCDMLARITGTGCMLNVLVASFISTGRILAGAVLATAFLGICGELSLPVKGTGMFRANLLDTIYSLTDEEFSKAIRWTVV